MPVKMGIFFMMKLKVKKNDYWSICALHHKVGEIDPTDVEHAYQSVWYHAVFSGYAIARAILVIALKHPTPCSACKKYNFHKQWFIKAWN
jgi:hypothetical protein